VPLGFWEFVALCFAPNRAPLDAPLVAAYKTPTNDPRTASNLAVLALAMVPVALLWWVWIRMLD
jgi:hypothetical protein